MTSRTRLLAILLPSVLIGALLTLTLRRDAGPAPHQDSPPAPSPGPEAEDRAGEEQGATRAEVKTTGAAASPALPPRLDQGINGLVGAQAQEMGSSGLGARGVGLGGGGALHGIGGLGTKGRGSGSAGYGSGTSAYGAAERAAYHATARIPEVYRSTDESPSEAGPRSPTNPYTAVAEDRLSTFAIDVDTASYSQARRVIQSGGLPQADSVRPEEFINYFHYGYSQPPSLTSAEGGPAPTALPFSVDMEAMPDPFRPGHHTLRIGVQGRAVARDSRPSVHLTFLVDVSGSMAADDKLGLAQRSLHLLVDGLREDDTVALATYAGRVATLLEPTPAGQAATVHAAIDALSSGGSTAMSAGIDLAYGLAQSSFEPGHENRVIILSDGDANVGNTSWDELLSQIKGAADRGVTLSTIGFGVGNYQDTLMEQLADKGDGNNYYIDSESQAKRVFVQGLGGTLVTIARDVKIQVEMNPESVLSYRLIGYENRDVADKDFRNDRIDGGEVGSGHQVTALYDVQLKEGYAPTLATVRLRWERPGADSTAQERAYPFPDRALRETLSLTTPDTRIAYAAATFAELLRGSDHAPEIELGALLDLTRAAARAGNKDDAELLRLIERARAVGLPSTRLSQR